MKYVPFSALQVKHLFCKKLATCLYTTRIHNEEQQGHEADNSKEDEMKKDWMLAAAVLDRVCAIAVTIVFIGGTVAFLAVFVAHP